MSAGIRRIHYTLPLSAENTSSVCQFIKALTVTLYVTFDRLSFPHGNGIGSIPVSNGPVLDPDRGIHIVWNTDVPAVIFEGSLEHPLLLGR